MSLINVIAKLSCDECDKRWQIDVDSGFDGSVQSAIEESLMNGMAEGSYEDGQYYCSECTAKRDQKWIDEHPTFISGIRRSAGGWTITTYAEVEHFIPADHTNGEPKFDQDSKDWLS